jgi:hypothetical protein
MAPRVFTNPQAFQQECKDVNVTLELLLEAQYCVGKQQTARFFTGKCKRGGGTFVSSALIEDWIVTLKHAKEHPEEKDDALYQRPREVLPTDEWKAFVKLAHVPIEDIVIKSWEKLSKVALGKEAKKHGMTFGTANFKALSTLHSRMLEMVERRRTLFWKPVSEVQIVENQIPENLKLLNMHQLKAIAKDIGVTSLHLNKDALIERIQIKRQQIAEESKDIFNQAYEDMSLYKLKLICKERNVTEYIQKTREELIATLQELDKQVRQQEDRFTLGGVEIISRPGDHYVNVTQLCKAGGKLFGHWCENGQAHEFLSLLAEKIDLKREQLIDSVLTGKNEERGTWVHPRVAIQIAQWISPTFALNVSEWIEKLLSTGSVSLSRPIQGFTALTDIDSEAIELERLVSMNEFTHYSTIYIAYIGRGLVKVGFSDGNIVQRNDKHNSCESEYPQYRIIKLIRVSGRPMERDVHKDLFPFQVTYNRQKEVFKPTTTLRQFIERVEQFLFHHDIRLRYDELSERYQELENKLLKIKVWALENQVNVPAL